MSLICAKTDDATGTGALGTVSSDQPQARCSFRALYFDPIGRFRFEADFGTNGGAVLDRPVAVPESSSTVLVSETRYAKDGQPGVQIDREGVKTITKRDKLSRDVETVEAAGTDEARTTRFRWHPSGQLEALILVNPDTGEEVTTWRYGSTLSDSGVARNDLPVGKIYPTGESETQTWNRQSDLLAVTDCNGSEHAYFYDKLGQLMRDSVPTLADGLDGSVRRLDFTFNDQGRLSLATSWSDPEPGSGSVVNEVGFAYDAFGSLASDAQEHSGAVNANTPTVSYARTDGSNNLYRQTGITYPSGVSQEIHYGASGSIDDAFNRADRLKVAGEATDLVTYEFAGIGRVVTLDYPGTDAQLSYLKPANFVGTGDAGDNMTGYDRFGRTVAMPWAKRSDGTPLADVGYGYDRMSRRTFRGDATPAADGEFDQYFTYDPLGQIKQRSRGTLNGSRNAVGGIPEENESWQYDEQGNWLGYDLNEDGNAVIQQTRTHNRSNQIVSIDGSGAGTAYDANGNMILIPTGRDLEGAPNQVTWDAWNRITEVRDDAGALIAEYGYDALYRWVTRQLPGEALRHTYYNQAWRPVEEREGTGADAEKLWWWGDRHRDDLARRDRDTDGNGTLNESLWCLMDYFDPIAVVNSSGDVQERYSYSAFGVSRVAAADYAERASSSFDWEFRFHGQFEDVETGWMNYGYRYYVPALGMWPSRDPMGVQGGLNLYRYVSNAAVNQNDFRGLFEDQDCDGNCPEGLVPDDKGKCCRPTQARRLDRYQGNPVHDTNGDGEQTVCIDGTGKRGGGGGGGPLPGGGANPGRILTHDQCCAICAVLAREKAFGTNIAAILSSNTVGDRVLEPLNSTFNADLDFDFGKFDPDWFTDSTAGGSFIGGVAGPLAAYALGKSWWYGMDKVMDFTPAPGSSISPPFSTEGERNAALKASLRTNYSDIFTAKWLADNKCDCRTCAP